jgi:hypothetical protein
MEGILISFTAPPPKKIVLLSSLKKNNKGVFKRKADFLVTIIEIIIAERAKKTLCFCRGLLSVKAFYLITFTSDA